ncbi:MAG: BamA/TamA family outer membrane protein [Cyclobacteriaceae bacterium]
MINNLIKILVLIVGWSVIYSCGVSKYIPEGEKLYTGGNIKLKSDEKKVEDLSEVNEELQYLLKPTPNTDFLGIRIGLHAWYKAQSGKSGFINKFMNKRFGQEPIYLSDINIDKTEELLYNRLENRGFFRSEIAHKIQQKPKFASLTYTAEVEKPYKVKNFELVKNDSLGIFKVMEESMAESFIRPGVRFSLKGFKNERNRIDEYLKKNGYYNFNSEYLIFEADTNKYDIRGFDLFLRLKKEVPKSALVPYNVSEISVFPKYTLNPDDAIFDTTVVDQVEYIQQDVFFRPDRLSTYLLVNEGERYNARASRLTSDRLSAIGTYKYINIRYDNLHNVGESDTLGHLSAIVELSPLNKRSLRAEVQAVSKSNNFVGPALAFSYANRNLFKGGELLKITASFGYERQITGKRELGLSSTQLGFKGELLVPRLLFPIDLRENFNYSVPKTSISTGIEFLDRNGLYQLNSVLTSFGYTWKSSARISYDLKPISINFVRLSDVTEDFQVILDENPTLAASFQQEFISGLTYTFTYSQLSEVEKRDPIYLSINADFAGNSLSLVSTKENERGASTFLGQEFAQYLKTDLDFRFHKKIRGEAKFVSRIYVGVGLPYGNSESLPFSKQYYSGGPYSIRAFRIRSIGPGIYQPTEDDSGSFFDQSGDIRLEGNMEYRFPISAYLKGALFFDAGNVWLLNENESLPGGKFTSDFASQLAMGSGIGLRVDVQNFVIRFDFATPLKKPWTGFSPEFAPVLNFAIGYPF